MINPEREARTSARLASASALAGVSGPYFVNGAPRKSSGRSHDEQVAARRWAVSSELTGADAPPLVGTA